MNHGVVRTASSGLAEAHHAGFNQTRVRYLHSSFFFSVLSEGVARAVIADYRTDVPSREWPGMAAIAKVMATVQLSPRMDGVLSAAREYADRLLFTPDGSCVVIFVNGGAE